MPKTTRRANGSGSIFYNPKTNKYVATIRWLDPKDNKMRQKSFTEPVREDAERRMEEFSASIQRKQEQLANKTAMIYSLFFQEWMTSVQQAEASAATYALKWKLANKHILPSLGSLHVDEISSRSVRELLARLVDAGYSSSLIRQVYSLLSGSFDGYIDKYDKSFCNPCLYVKPPSYKKPYQQNLQYLSGAQRESAYRAALSYAETHPGSYLPYGIILMLYTGIRLCEAVAVRREDVDTTQRILHISARNEVMDRAAENPSALSKRSARYENREIRGEDAYSVSRDVPLCDRALEVVSALLKAHKYRHLIVLPSGKVPTSVQFSSTLRAVLSAADIPYADTARVSTHLCRLSFELMLAESGASYAEIARIMGIQKEESIRNFCARFLADGPRCAPDDLRGFVFQK